MAITAESILEQLDVAARKFVFPMLDNGYVYPADVRMSIYRDQDNWLMIIEALGSGWPRSGGYNSFCNTLHIFGNALHRPFGTADGDLLYPVICIPENPLFDDDEYPGGCAPMRISSVFEKPVWLSTCH